jgi:hypothetical protein
VETVNDLVEMQADLRTIVYPVLIDSLHYIVSFTLLSCFTYNALS